MSHLLLAKQSLTKSNKLQFPLFRFKPILSKNAAVGNVGSIVLKFRTLVHTPRFIQLILINLFSLFINLFIYWLIYSGFLTRLVSTDSAHLERRDHTRTRTPLINRKPQTFVVLETIGLLVGLLCRKHAAGESFSTGKRFIDRVRFEITTKVHVESLCWRHGNNGHGPGRRDRQLGLSSRPSSIFSNRRPLRSYFKTGRSTWNRSTKNTLFTAWECSKATQNNSVLA